MAYTNAQNYSPFMDESPALPFEKDLEEEIHKLFELCADGTFTPEEAKEGLNTFFKTRT